MTDQEVTKKPRSANKWITFLKNYSQIHNLPYASCISNVDCKQAYLASKSAPVVDPTPPVVEPVEAVVEPTPPVPETEPVETDIKKSKKTKKPKKDRKKKKKNQSEHSVSEPIDIPVSE